MIKEILMLMLLLQFTNGKNRGWGGGKHNDSCTGGEVLIKHTKILFPYEKICISSNHKDDDIKKHPGKYLQPISQTNLNVIIERIKIVSIDDHGLIIGFELEVKWLENRFKIWHWKADEPFDLTKQEYTEDLFWVPHLNYGTGFVLDTDKLRKMSLSNKNGTIVSQIFYVTTSMECKMDNVNFPFDHHNCTLEVKF